jgi:hypothetical protein
MGGETLIGKILKRKRIFLLALIIALGITLFIKGREESIIKALKADYPGQPTVIFIIDSRNVQSIQFVTDFFSYLDRNQLLLNIAVVFTNSRVFPFKGRYQVIEKESIRHFEDFRDSFLFFGHEGKLVLRGILSSIPDSLLNLINPQYELDNSSVYEKIKQSADTLEQISFFAEARLSLDVDFTCFTFFDQICLCNNSINTIRWITENEKQGSIIRHFVVPMSSYSQREIELIKNNNDYAVNFILPNTKDIAIWDSIKTDPLHKHPLNELVILVDRQGKILLFSNKWSNYILWREEHNTDYKGGRL